MGMHFYFYFDKIDDLMALLIKNSSCQSKKFDTPLYPVQNISFLSVKGSRSSSANNSALFNAISYFYILFNLFIGKC